MPRGRCDAAVRARYAGWEKILGCSSITRMRGSGRVFPLFPFSPSSAIGLALVAHVTPHSRSLFILWLQKPDYRLGARNRSGIGSTRAPGALMCGREPRYGIRHDQSGSGWVSRRQDRNRPSTAVRSFRPCSVLATTDTAAAAAVAATSDIECL